tara:strand:+ start:65 stop:448 length:384 start_codon:yes stop_codon:yes gene_type:complete
LSSQNDVNYAIGTSPLRFQAEEPGTNTYYADVILPHGATVTGFTFTSPVDNGNSTVLSLMRAGTSTSATGTTMASITSSGGSSPSTTTITNPTINNNDYHYYLSASMERYASVNGATITYTVSRSHD